MSTGNRARTTTYSQELQYKIAALMKSKNVRIIIQMKVQFKIFVNF